MDGGFSFCGIEAGKLGIQYAPDMPSTYIYGETYSEHQEAFEGHDGSLHYGTNVKAKQFRLRCYFENSHVNEGILDRVLDFFYRGRTGRLVFAQRDWLWYSATVASVDTTQLRNYLNGFITINLVAHYPFGRCDFMSFDSYDDVESITSDTSILEKTGFILTSQMPQKSFSNISADTTFVLYNPGNEYADVAVSVSGEANQGFSIINVTTGQEERLRAFTKALTTNVNQHVVCDSLNGKTALVGSGTAIAARIYHDYGFIRLAPARTIKRNISVSVSGTTVTSEGAFDSEDIGKFILLGGNWFKIATVNNENTLTIENILGESVPETEENAVIALVNEIVVQLGTGVVLDELSFAYKPTFR